MSAETLLMFVPRVVQMPRGGGHGGFTLQGQPRAGASAISPSPVLAALEERRKEKLERICFTWKRKEKGQ